MTKYPNLFVEHPVKGGLFISIVSAYNKIFAPTRNSPLIASFTKPDMIKFFCCPNISGEIKKMNETKSRKVFFTPLVMKLLNIYNIELDKNI